MTSRTVLATSQGGAPCASEPRTKGAFHSQRTIAPLLAVLSGRQQHRSDVGPCTKGASSLPPLRVPGTKKRGADARGHWNVGMHESKSRLFDLDLAAKGTQPTVAYAVRRISKAKGPTDSVQGNPGVASPTDERKNQRRVLQVGALAPLNSKRISIASNPLSSVHAAPRVGSPGDLYRHNSSPLGPFCSERDADDAALGASVTTAVASTCMASRCAPEDTALCRRDTGSFRSVDEARNSSQPAQQLIGPSLAPAVAQGAAEQLMQRHTLALHFEGKPDDDADHSGRRFGSPLPTQWSSPVPSLMQSPTRPRAPHDLPVVGSGDAMQYTAALVATRNGALTSLSPFGVRPLLDWSERTALRLLSL